MRLFILAAAGALCACARAAPEGPTLPPVKLLRLPSEFGPPPMGGLPTLALGDCNEDGLVDVVMTGYGVHEQLLVRRGDGSLQPKRFLGDRPGPPLNVRAQVSTFADLDGDGSLDLVLVGTSDDLVESGVMLLKGHGDCRFDPPQMVLPIREPTPLIIGLVQVTDVDLDGLPDVTFTYKMETQRIFKVLLGQGEGRFTELPVSSTPFVSLQNYLPFGTLWDDVDGDGVRDLFALIDFGGAWFSWGAPGLLPSYTRDESVSKIFSNVHTMGVAPLDADRDGAIDYFISGLYMQNLLLQGGSRAMTNRADAVGLNRADMVQASKAWGSYAFDAELDGWPDLLVIRTLDPLDARPGVDPGPPVIFHSQRNGRFFQESELKSHELWTDARSMWCGDMRSDGHVQCYLRTNDNDFPILRPEAEAVGHWVGVRLRGTVSSPEAEGARVSLSGANPPVVLYAGAATPTDAQHDRGVIVPIGVQTEAAIDIHWPSGIVQRVEGLKADRYRTIEEPRLLTISKHLVPADGQSTVDVSVDAALTGEAVSIEMEGAGEWVGPMARSDAGLWTRTLRAPAEEGLARINVKLGQTMLAVRPRITFVTLP